MGSRYTQPLSRSLVNCTKKELKYEQKVEHKKGTEKWQQELLTYKPNIKILSCGGSQVACWWAGEWYNNDCLQATWKHSGGSFWVCGCTSANGDGDMARKHGVCNAKKIQLDTYLSILQHHQKGIWIALFFLQHDNDSKHTAKVIKNYLKHRDGQGHLGVWFGPHRALISTELRLCGITWRDKQMLRTT